MSRTFSFHSLLVLGFFFREHLKSEASIINVADEKRSSNRRNSDWKEKQKW